MPDDLAMRKDVERWVGRLSPAGESRKHREWGDALKTFVADLLHSISEDRRFARRAMKMNQARHISASRLKT